jgi:hypothetical protein
MGWKIFVFIEGMLVFVVLAFLRQEAAMSRIGSIR